MCSSNVKRFRVLLYCCPVQLAACNGIIGGPVSLWDNLVKWLPGTARIYSADPGLFSAVLCSACSGDLADHVFPTELFISTVTNVSLGAPVAAYIMIQKKKRRHRDERKITSTHRGLTVGYQVP